MSFFLITLFICFHETSMIQSLNKGINSGKLLGVTQKTVISHLKNTVIVSVENLFKNYMHYPEYYNVYHQIRSVFCSSNHL